MKVIVKTLLVILSIAILGCSESGEKQQISDDAFYLHSDNWYESGQGLVTSFEENPETVVAEIFKYIMPHGRNQPELWVLEMIRLNYGDIDFTEGQISTLKSLRYENEYQENLSFATHLDLALDGR